MIAEIKRDLNVGQETRLAATDAKENLDSGPYQKAFLHY